MFWKLSNPCRIDLGCSAFPDQSPVARAEPLRVLPQKLPEKPSSVQWEAGSVRLRARWSSTHVNSPDAVHVAFRNQRSPFRITRDVAPHHLGVIDGFLRSVRGSDKQRHRRALSLPAHIRVGQNTVTVDCGRAHSISRNTNTENGNRPTADREASPVKGALEDLDRRRGATLVCVSGGFGCQCSEGSTNARHCQHLSEACSPRRVHRVVWINR